MTHGNVTAIIPHYWPSRNKNLRQCINALNAGTVPPQKIIIWNNGVMLDDVFPTNVRVLNWPENLGCKARFVAAMCADTDYVLFQDNDLRVDPYTVEALLDWNSAVFHPTDGGAIVALEGRNLIPDQPYEHCDFVDGKTLSRELVVDISIGRLELVKRRTVQQLLADYPFEPSTTMDDIWFSYCAMQHRIPRLVIPYGSGTGFYNLDQAGVGAYRSPTHMAERDELCQRLFPQSRFSK